MVGHGEFRVIQHRLLINVIGLASFHIFFFSKLLCHTFGNFAQVVGCQNVIQQSMPLSQLVQGPMETWEQSPTV